MSFKSTPEAKLFAKCEGALAQGLLFSLLAR